MGSGAGAGAGAVAGASGTAAAAIVRMHFTAIDGSEAAQRHGGRLCLLPFSSNPHCLFVPSFFPQSQQSTSIGLLMVAQLLHAHGQQLLAVSAHKVTAYTPGRLEVQSLSVPRARSRCGFFECARDQLCDPQALELVISMQILRILQRSCCVQALERVLDRVRILCVYKHNV